MSAGYIGEILAPVIYRAERLYGFQTILRRCPTAEDRKTLILSARERGAITDEDAQLLIEAHGLETA